MQIMQTLTLVFSTQPSKKQKQPKYYTVEESIHRSYIMEKLSAYLTHKTADFNKKNGPQSSIN